jgi:hypothetical protein
MTIAARQHKGQSLHCSISACGRAAYGYCCAATQRDCCDAASHDTVNAITIRWWPAWMGLAGAGWGGQQTAPGVPGGNFRAMSDAMLCAGGAQA